MTSWNTISTDTSARRTTTSFPPCFSIRKEAMKPTEQKNAIMKTFFKVSSKSNSAMSALWSRQLTRANTRPPTTAAGKQKRLSVLDFLTSTRPNANARAPIAAVWYMSRSTLSIRRQSTMWVIILCRPRHQDILVSNTFIFLSVSFRIRPILSGTWP